MTDIRLTVQGLAVDYPTARVVDNVSFTLGNERLALVGESGSGKSMTARALMGLVRKPGVVSAERLEVLGRDVLTLSARGWRALRRSKTPSPPSVWICRSSAAIPANSPAGWDSG